MCKFYDEYTENLNKFMQEKIRKRVIQSLSPYQFNKIIREKMLREKREEKNGKSMDISFEDDTAFVTDSEINKMLPSLTNVVHKFKLRIKTRK